MVALDQENGRLPRELASRKVVGQATNPAWIRSVQQGLLWRTGFDVRLVALDDAVDHLFTHLSLRVLPARCEVLGGELLPQPPVKKRGPIANYEEWAWLRLEDVMQLPMGKVMTTMVNGLSKRAAQLKLF